MCSQQAYAVVGGAVRGAAAPRGRALWPCVRAAMQ
jgi:hypothetical protein